jgi:GAF domain-containing protein
LDALRSNGHGTDVPQPGAQLAAWKTEEVELLEAIIEQLGAAMDSARLYEETRRTAERERLTSEITSQMRSTNDPQAILQIAARELRKALRADKAQLVVQTAVSPSQSDHDAQAGTQTGGQS